MKSPGYLKQGVSDPLQREIHLPFQRTYHPFGFPLNLASNSTEALVAAEKNWGMFEAEYDEPPLTLRVVVQPGEELSPRPAHRSQDHLYSVIGGRDNYAVADFDALFAYAWVTERTIADHPLFRWFYLDALAGATLAQRHTVPMHAACVERNGIGVLLWGPSGMGKSTLAYACARAGWTFISDDAAILPQNAGGCAVTGKSHLARFRDDAPQLFPEFEGFATRARPTGKLSIEVSMATFPGIRTAVRCEVRRLVFLERGDSTGLESIGVEKAFERMTHDSQIYGPETQARHTQAMRRLLCIPAYRMRYQGVQDAMEMLQGLTA